MHGFIFIEFEKFIIGQVGYIKWQEKAKALKLNTQTFSPTEIYPDNKLVQMVQAGAEASQRSPERILERFGTFLVPDLLKVYRAYIEPGWTSLDLLENAETTIHVAVRKSTNGAAPPILNITRQGPREILIEYISGRNMPELGVGIIKGIGTHYNENLEVSLQKIPEEGRSLISVRLIA